MARFNQGDKVRLKKDYYKHDWFRGLYRERRKAISEKAGKVARITTNDMSDICQEYPNGVVEIRFNDRTFCRVHEDMLEYAVTNNVGMNNMDILECIVCGHKARFYADGSINAFVNGAYLCNKCWDTLEEYLKEHYDEVVNWIKERNGAE